MSAIATPRTPSVPLGSIYLFRRWHGAVAACACRAEHLRLSVAVMGARSAARAWRCKLPRAAFLVHFWLLGDMGTCCVAGANMTGEPVNLVWHASHGEEGPLPAFCRDLLKAVCSRGGSMHSVSSQ